MKKHRKMNLQLFGEVKNPDLLAQQKALISVQMHEAMQSGDEEKFTEAFTQYTDMLQEAVMAEARGLVQASDNQVLSGRGARILTNEEKVYYEKLIKAFQSGTPEKNVNLIDDTLPKTVIDAIFEDITENHPLLGAINFQNTEMLVEILVSTIDGRFLAVWGELDSEVTESIGSGFETINLRQSQLTAFIPVGRAMLEIGPEWLDRYVRTILGEAIANGLEKGIIDGTGVNSPVGMRRNPGGAKHPTTGYPLLDLVPFTQITPETYGGVIAELAQGPNNLVRPVTEVLLVVNPIDYFTKLLPSTSSLVNGTWLNNIFPFPTRVVQSVWVPQNEAIMGLANKYFFGLGIGGEGGKIEFSDHVRFLKRERVYLTILTGHGQPLDNKSFKRLNITNLHPAYPIVRVSDYVDARLSAIALTDEKTAVVNFGTFNENIHAYSAAIADAEVAGDNDTASLTVTPKDENATIVVKNGTTTVTAGETGAYSLTLTAGANIITITSSVNGVETEAYVLVITYTPVAGE